MMRPVRRPPEPTPGRPSFRSSSLRGLILAAGFGTRLGHRPKAFLQVGGATVLDRAVASLEAAGISRVTVVHNARWAGSFDRWARERSSGPQVDLLNDGALDVDGRMGAAGDLLIGLAAIGGADALVFPVDNVLTWPIADFLAAASPAAPAIALRAARHGHEALGQVDVGPDGVVRNFYQGRRPDGGSAWTGRVWLGPVYLPADARADLEAHVAERRLAGAIPDSLGEFVAALARRRAVRGVLMDSGEAWDVGTPEELAAAQAVLGP